MENYQYMPLPADHSEIRLVSLQPGLGDDINIEIIHVKVASQPDYEALSYVWGSPERIDKVFVAPSKKNSIASKLQVGLRNLYRREKAVKILRIACNLAKALRNLKLSFRPRLIWIDAICINQDNLSERSSEVSEMGSIYKNAREVIVWLGPESNTSRLALKALTEIGQSTRYDKRKNLLEASTDSLWARLNNPVALKSKRNWWWAVRELLSRDWFSRLWIFQEICLARKAHIIVGHGIISWETFVSGIWAVRALKSLDQLFEGLHIQDLIRESIYPFLNIDNQGTHGHQLGFRAVLNCAQQLHSSDPRDKLYGIQSILRPEYAILIHPDYSRTVEEVFICFAKECLSIQENPFVFCNLLLEDRMPGLPSWVPDWSRPCGTNPWDLTYCSGRSAISASINAENHLSLQGVLVGKIAYSSPTVEPIRDEFPDICRSWLEMISVGVSTEKELDQVTAISMFYCTISGGRLRELSPTSEESRTATFDQFTAFLAGLSHQFDSCTNLISLAIQGRSFFIAEDGTFGLSAAGTKPGDVVAIVLGSDCPLILRPCEDLSSRHFQLVGIGYAASYMFSEALLGPIPLDWTARFEYVQGVEVITFSDGYSITQQDARMELPPDWRYLYGTYDEPEEVEASTPGDMSVQWFENVRSGEKTYFDPRLRPDFLMGNGVAVQEIVLV